MVWLAWLAPKKTHVATLGKRRSSNILQRLAGFFSPLGNESQREETELRSQTAEALSIILVIRIIICYKEIG